MSHEYLIVSPMLQRIITVLSLLNVYFHLMLYNYLIFDSYDNVRDDTLKIIQERKEYHARTDHRYLTGFKEIPNKKDDNDANIEST